MSHWYQALGVVFCLLLVGGAARAAAEPAAPPPGQAAAPEAPCPSEAAPLHEVEEMVVIGRRAPESAFVCERSTGVISEVQLHDRTPRTVPEALRESPGVFVQQTNPGGGSPIVRGLVGPQNLILVDGVRFNNSLHRTGPTQYLNLIDPLSLSRLEVLRGPGSVLYGSDAMGGVIEAIPVGPKDYRTAESWGGGGRMLLRYGSAAQQRTLHGMGQVGRGGAALLGGVTYSVFDDLKGGRGVGVQPHSGYGHLGAIGRAIHRFADDGPLSGFEVSASYLMALVIDAGRADRYWTRQEARSYDNEDHLAFVRLKGKLRPLQTTFELTGTYHGFRERHTRFNFDEAKLLNEATEVETARSREEFGAHTVGLDLRLVSEVLSDDLLRLRYGGTWYRDLVSSEELLRREPGGDWRPQGRFAYPDGSRYDLYGGFLMVESDPVASESGHILRLSSGYRLHGVAGHAPARGELPGAEFSHLGHVFSGAVSHLYRDKSTLALTYSQGFRAPSLFETVMLGDTGNYFHIPGGDGLGPERSDTIELIGRLRLGSFFVEATGYVTFLNDLIKRVASVWEGEEEFDGRPVVQNQNRGRGILWGVESRASVALGAGISVRGNLTYTWGEEMIDGGPNEPLSRIPPLFGRLAVRYDYPGATGRRAFAEMFFQGALRQRRLSELDIGDDRIPEGGTPGWWTANLRGGISLLDELRVLLTVENLLDRKYKYHASGVYGAGTNVVLTLEGSL